VKLEPCAQDCRAALGGGDRHDGCGGRLAPAGRGQDADFADQPVAVPVWHHDVADQDVGTFALDHLERRRRAPHGHDGPPARLENGDRLVPQAGLVLDEQDRLAFIDQHDPEVIVYDLPRPYESHWNFLRLLKDTGALRARI
jgi:hypothetical protein